MAELLVERGQIPGDSPRSLTGLDNVTHDPRGPWSAMCLRMCGGVIILDRSNWQPVCFFNATNRGEGNIPVKKVSSMPDTWEVKLPAVRNPVHEAGFNPSGRDFVICNNLRDNSVAHFDVSNADPRQWKRRGFVRSADWKGEFPAPFHVCFSVDGSKMFLSVLRPKPAMSDVAAIDTKTWKIIKTFPNVGPDCETAHVTYDGKYVLQIFSGCPQACSFLRRALWNRSGYAPNFGGHHDCVVVPSKVEELKYSRCCTV